MDDMEGYNDVDELPDILGEDLGYLLGWVALGETLGNDDGEEAARAMGEAIVGCEEMQAIKAALLFHAEEYSLEAIGVSASGGDPVGVGLPDVVVSGCCREHRHRSGTPVMVHRCSPAIRRIRVPVL